MQELGNILEIILITYNRKNHLSKTLIKLLDDNSPFKTIPLTVLDNASTDGSSELIAEYCAKYHNLRHIRHPRNIGGNANIARAFELASKEYVWVICDDDEYNFEHFEEFTAALAKKPDAVIVANYLNPKKSTARLFKQLSFVPAAVYKTTLITETVLMNAYFNISNMFPQLAIGAALLNNNGNIIILDNPLVRMLSHKGQEDYNRGTEITVLHPLMKQMFWELGYINSIKMITDKSLRARLFADMHPQNKGLYALVLRVSTITIPRRLRYLADFIAGLDIKRRLIFLFLMPFLYICAFEKRETGIYIHLFGFMKTKIVPFKHKKSNDR